MHAATDVEKDFMHRWIDKRTNELVTQGLAASAARDQAVAEFKSTFSYINTVNQAK
jgi:hypothetical protein